MIPAPIPPRDPISVIDSLVLPRKRLEPQPGEYRVLVESGIRDGSICNIFKRGRLPVPVDTHRQVYTLNRLRFEYLERLLFFYPLREIIISVYTKLRLSGFIGKLRFEEIA